MSQVSRYHPLLVTLHWLIALMIFAMLGAGYYLAVAMPNADPHKIDLLRLHMAGGMLVLALTLVRFGVRLWSAHPPAAATGHNALDRLARLWHLGLYALIVLMVGTGYATGLFAGLPAIVFAGSGDPLPQSFAAYPTFIAHALLALILVAFVAVHVLAALYHQFVRKDGLLARMSYGRRQTP